MELISWLILGLLVLATIKIIANIVMFFTGIALEMAAITKIRNTKEIMEFRKYCEENRDLINRINKEKK